MSSVAKSCYFRDGRFAALDALHNQYRQIYSATQARARNRKKSHPARPALVDMEMQRRYEDEGTAWHLLGPGQRQVRDDLAHAAACRACRGTLGRRMLCQSGMPRVVDTRLVTKYNIFVLEVVKAWVDPGQPKPKTIHHIGRGAFLVDGETIHFDSRMP
ncbi:hypothetical protein [Mesorhizobium sp. B2-4-11]|uniref:hypothetical protein n=1 Tax=Mesorhizobium sp. B2-4-11 TaxID=2589938 RepID=UPI001AEEB650